MSTPDGGPAFPCEVRRNEYRDGRWVDRWIPEGGMSLRDYFAVHILQATVTSARLDGIALQHPEHEAVTAYEWADAMLKARSNQHD